MNELLHKFKLGNEAELLLEKRGGGYEKVATVPIGSQALGVTQSAQGVNIVAGSKRPVLSSGQLATVRDISPLRGKTVQSFNSAPLALVGCTSEIVSTPDVGNTGPGNYKLGKGSGAKITWSGTGSAQYVFSVSADQRRALLTGGAIEFWIYVPDRKGLNNNAVAVCMGFDKGAGSGFVIGNYDLTRTLEPYSGWHRYVVRKSDFVFTAPEAGWENITHGRIYFTSGQPFTVGQSVYLDQITAGASCARKKPTLSILVDRAYQNLYDYGVHELHSRGLRFSTSLVASRIGTTVGGKPMATADMVHELDAMGVHFCPHTVADTVSFADIASCVASLQANRDGIAALGLKNYDDDLVIYSSGNYSLQTYGDRALAEYLQNSGWCVGAYRSSGDAHIGPMGYLRWQMPSRFWQGPTLDSALAAEIAALRAWGQAGWSMQIRFHDLVLSGASLASETNLSTFQAACDGLAQIVDDGIFDLVYAREQVLLSA